MTRPNAISSHWDATCADTRSQPSGDSLPQNACSPKNRCRETSSITSTLVSAVWLHGRLKKGDQLAAEIENLEQQIR